MPRARFVLSAVAAASFFIAGCASRSSTTVATQPAPTQAPAGYACSSAHVFSQPVGVPVRQQATLGDTTAVLTGTTASDGVEPSALRDGVLTITRAGHPPLVSSVGSVDLFTLDTQAQHSSADDETAGSLCLSRFAEGAATVALLALTTGGAHCCVTVRAISSSGGAPVDHAFGNYPPWFRATAAGPVLVSADNAFAYQFGSFAGSGPPVRLFAWSGTTFTDVTRQHLDLVAQDAQNYLALYNDPSQPEKLGSLAGWVADECVLGKATAAWAFVDTQRHLGTTVALRAFLVAQRYCS